MTEKEFTKWIKWQDRHLVKRLDLPGVYAIAVTDIDLTNKTFNLTQDIKYFGMTNSKSGLKGRLRQFDNTIKGKRGHGGADRFRFKYPNYNNLIKKLFVSVVKFDCNVSSNTPKDLEIMGEVSKFEYVCFANYVRRFSNLPEFNDKKNAPKYSLTFKKSIR